MKTRVAMTLATWFGCGLSPVAPGTVGSLGALVPAWLLAAYAGWPPWAFGVLGAAIAIPGVWAAGIAERASGREDPGLVVIDEVAGQWITMAGAHVINWKSALAAFLIFRALDIWKPPPARQFDERLHGGLGIMADDVMVGIYGAAILWAAGAWIPGSLQ